MPNKVRRPVRRIVTWLFWGIGLVVAVYAMGALFLAVEFLIDYFGVPDFFGLISPSFFIPALQAWFATGTTAAIAAQWVFRALMGFPAIVVIAATFFAIREFALERIKSRDRLDDDSLPYDD